MDLLFCTEYAPVPPVKPPLSCWQTLLGYS